MLSDTKVVRACSVLCWLRIPQICKVHHNTLDCQTVWGDEMLTMAALTGAQFASSGLARRVDMITKKLSCSKLFKISHRFESHSVCLLSLRPTVFDSSYCYAELALLFALVQTIRWCCNGTFVSICEPLYLSVSRFIWHGAFRCQALGYTASSLLVLTLVSAATFERDCRNTGHGSPMHIVRTK